MADEVSVTERVWNTPDGLCKLERWTLERRDPDAFLSMLAQRVAGGEGLIAVCKSRGLPHGIVLLWLMEDVTRWNLYANAMRAGAFHEADEAKQIADDAEEDTWVDDEGVTHVRHDVIQRAKLRVATRQWRAAKHAPDVYGDKVQLQAPANPGATIDGALEMMARALLDKMRVVNPRQELPDAQS